jgi:hypothetical protein
LLFGFIGLVLSTPEAEEADVREEVRVRAAILDFVGV